MRRIILLVILLAFPSVLAAQDTNDAALAAMEGVPDLVGTWEGEGWIRMGPGDPHRFVGREIVESRLGGRVLLVEGEHWSPDRSQRVHHAFGVLAHDEDAGGLRFRTMVTGRGSGDHAARVEDGALVWEMADERPRRFVIRVENDQWIETGEVQIDGKWRKFFEMKLDRKRS